MSEPIAKLSMDYTRFTHTPPQSHFPTKIPSLSVEVLIPILGFLDATTLLRCSYTCTSWRQIILYFYDESIWRPKVYRLLKSHTFHIGEGESWCRIWRLFRRWSSLLVANPSLLKHHLNDSSRSIRKSLDTVDLHENDGEDSKNVQMMEVEDDSCLPPQFRASVSTRMGTTHLSIPDVFVQPSLILNCLKRVFSLADYPGIQALHYGRHWRIERRYVGGRFVSNNTSRSIRIKSPIPCIPHQATSVDSASFTQTCSFAELNTVRRPVTTTTQYKYSGQIWFEDRGIYSIIINDPILNLSGEMMNADRRFQIRSHLPNPLPSPMPSTPSPTSSLPADCKMNSTRSSHLLSMREYFYNPSYWIRTRIWDPSLITDPLQAGDECRPGYWVFSSDCMLTVHVCGSYLITTFGEASCDRIKVWRLLDYTPHRPCITLVWEKVCGCDERIEHLSTNSNHLLVVGYKPWRGPPLCRVEILSVLSGTRFADVTGDVMQCVGLLGGGYGPRVRLKLLRFHLLVYTNDRMAVLDIIKAEKRNRAQFILHSASRFHHGPAGRSSHGAASHANKSRNFSGGNLHHTASMSILQDVIRLPLSSWTHLKSSDNLPESPRMLDIQLETTPDESVLLVISRNRPEIVVAVDVLEGTCETFSCALNSIAAAQGAAMGRYQKGLWLIVEDSIKNGRGMVMERERKVCWIALTL